MTDGVEDRKLRVKTGDLLLTQPVQLAPMRTTAVSQEDRLNVTKKRLVRQVGCLMQADRHTLRPLRRTQQARLTRLSAVLNGPRAIRVACLHHLPRLTHRRRAL